MKLANIKVAIGTLALAGGALVAGATTASAHIDVCAVSACVPSPVDTDPAHVCVDVLYGGHLVYDQASVSGQECSN
jgi:hypothetical protein